MSLLPSPPPQLPPSTYTLPHSSGLNPPQIESLRSSVDQARVAIQELTRMVELGGEQGIVGWPTLLTSYQNLLSLLGLIAHHLSPPPAPSSTNPFALNKGGPPVNPLTQLLVHPIVGVEPALDGGWIPALLMQSLPSLHSPPLPPPPTGTPEDHALRLDRARRVCSLLEDQMMWRGRVGVVDDDAEGESENESGSDEEDEDMFGSADEDGDDAMDGGKKKDKGKGKAEEKGEKEVVLSKEEREKELKRLVGIMVRGAEAE
ncbi:hypothetical protein BDY24DRAFT_392707 [Mrakia frigida]|uniref:uncharacterized protein n=1 Tax=Mrakia frigida TaxID=29902 RepID=UPI003FCC23BD